MMWGSKEKGDRAISDEQMEMYLGIASPSVANTPGFIEGVEFYASSILPCKIEEARREAANDFCAECPGKCAYECRWDECPDRAAILGRRP